MITSEGTAGQSGRPLFQALAMLAVWASPVAEAGDAGVPAFQADTFVMSGRPLVFRRGHPYHDDGLGTAYGRFYFGRVGIGTDEDTRWLYAVEGLPDKSSFRLSYKGDEFDVEIGVRPETGLLYAVRDEPMGTREAWRDDVFYNMNGFPLQRVEMSAEDAASGLQIYKEMLVGPPADAPDCSDYPSQDPDRWECLFHREQLPRGTPVATAAQLEGLPSGLVRPQEEYHLVFAEEFSSDASRARSDAAPACENGLHHLDSSIWNYGENSCESADVNGSLCGSLENGHLTMGISQRCRMFVSTDGKFSYRYGYMEVRYTLEGGGLDGYRNLAFVVGDPRTQSIRHWPTYGVYPENHQELSRYMDLEIDFFEFLPTSMGDLMSRYRNPYGYICGPDAEPRRSSKRVAYCGVSTDPAALHVSPSAGCGRRDPVTVVKGLEWTPRGFRTFIKVEGAHDALTVFPKDKIQITRKPVSISEVGNREASHGNCGEDSAYQYASAWADLTGDERDAFFESTGPLASDYLEQFALSHMPQDIRIYSWGWPTKADIRARVKIDYIRVFRPEDGYRDMEPLFQ